MSNPFNLPETRYIPEVDEVSITLARLKTIIAWTNSYNLQCKLGAAKDENGDPIPIQYVGRNRYWMSYAEGYDEVAGPYSLVVVYDLDPSLPDGRTLLVRYKITDSRGNIVQTAAQAQKHMIACQLEADRQEQMKKKDPRLTSSIDIHMPAIYSAKKAMEQLKKTLEKLRGSS